MHTYHLRSEAMPEGLIATWITNTFGVTALALRDLGLRDAEDTEIFEAAKAQGVIFMTKDSDFVDLVEGLGEPPQIILIQEFLHRVKATRQKHPGAKFAGILSDSEAEELQQAIATECRQVDINEW